MNFNPRKYFAIKQQSEKYLENVSTHSGIYIWKRVENNITYWYVGQAKNLKHRMTDYYLLKHGATWPKGHFQTSLKAHKDWKVEIIEECEESKLNEREQFWIQEYLKKPYHQTRNSTLGGQNGTKALGERVKHTPKKHINEFRERFLKGVGKTITQLNLEQNEGFIKFSVKTNKDGSVNKLSQKALDYLKKTLLN